MGTITIQCCPTQTTVARAIEDPGEPLDEPQPAAGRRVLSEAEIWLGPDPDDYDPPPAVIQHWRQIVARGCRHRYICICREGFSHLKTPRRLTP